VHLEFFRGRWEYDHVIVGEEVSAILAIEFMEIPEENAFVERPTCLDQISHPKHPHTQAQVEQLKAFIADTVGPLLHDVPLVVFIDGKDIAYCSIPRRSEPLDL
jgi:hypothetical protein